MTLWERVEALAARVGELESRLPKPAPVADPVERLPSDDAPIGALEAISEPVTFAGDRWPAGGGGIAGQKMWGHESVPGAVWVGDEPPTKEQVDAERQRRAIEGGLIPPPPPSEVQLLKEACDLLVEVYVVDRGFEERLADFLARARVATEKP